jgi:GT2 family glycosyltransferase
LCVNSSSRELSILIPALNEGPNLRRTVERVRETLPACTEIIVVDDGSDDGCADFLRGATELATLIEPGERLGAIGARNLAAAHAAGRTLVFLDAHVETKASWIDPLLHVLDDPAVGAVSPAIAVLGREEARGYGLCWTSAELSCTWLPPPPAPPFDVPLLPGACIVIRRAVFLSAGGFDRGLIRWGFEDAELSIRLWRLGYELRVVPDVAVAHLFRERHPYIVDWLWIVHNILRVAHVHFSAQRLARVIAAVGHYSCYAAASELVAQRDAAYNREFMRQYARRDDDAYFQRFGEICH